MLIPCSVHGNPSRCLTGVLESSSGTRTASQKILSAFFEKQNGSHLFLRSKGIFVSHPTQCNYCQSNHYHWYTEWQVSKQQILQRSSSCGNESVYWLSKIHPMASLMARNTVCGKKEENNSCEYATQRTNRKSENVEGILRKDHRSDHGRVHN